MRGRTTFYWVVFTLALVSGLATFRGSVSAQESEKFKNLKVLPKDISREDLRRVMGQFTRALGMRCSGCHVSTPGQGIGPDDWAKDDKPEKRTARLMMEMTRDLNEKYLANVEDRGTPPVQVQCFTCHHGAARPRTLQDVLQLAYAKGGVDTTQARYAALRDRYYGRAVYDFGEVSLADVASALTDSGHVADGNRLFALNAEMNPKSPFVQRQLAMSNVLLAFSQQGPDSGVSVYQRLKGQLGEPREQEGMLAGVADRLTTSGKTESALAAYRLNTTEHPESGDAFDALAGAYLKRGDKKLAIENYLRAAALDTANTNAVDQLVALKVSKSKIAKARAKK